MSDTKIRCNQCMNIFDDEYDLERFEDEDGVFEGCPECETDEYLMNVTAAEINSFRAWEAAETALKDALIEALEELVQAYEDIKCERVAGYPVPEKLRQRLQKAYERRDAARARLAEVRERHPEIDCIQDDE